MIKSYNYSVTTVAIFLFALATLVFHLWQLNEFLSGVHLFEFENIMSQTDLNKTPKTSFDTTVLFMGDVMLGRNVEFLSDINGIGYSTARIAGELPSADAVIANFESAMAVPHTRTRAYTTQFSTAVTMLPVLTSLGVTHASLANNHTLDFGEEGYKNAVAKLKDISITPFGHSTEVSSSSIVVIDGVVRIGIIALNTIFVNPNIEQVQLQINQLKKISDIQVAYIHWGDEYIDVHNTAQESFARILIQMGIDVIIGHHPHVVQNIDIINNVPVFYSLGNFIFDQYFSTKVQEGYLLLMKAEQVDRISFSIIPITSVDARSQPRKMTVDETVIFLEDLAARSDTSISSAILNNNLSIRKNLAQEEEMSMITE